MSSDLQYWADAPYRIRGVIKMPFEDRWMGREYNECPHLVFEGRYENVYLVPMLCPVCGREYHFASDKALSELSSELWGFDLGAAYYQYPLNLRERDSGLLRQQIELFTKMGHYDAEKQEFTPAGKAVNAKYQEDMRPAASVLEHTDIDAYAYPHVALLLEKYHHLNRTFDNPLDDKYLYLHPSGILKVRYLGMSHDFEYRKK